MKKARPSLYDGHIINRVEKYLEENVHKTYLDISDMTKHLQETYQEYNRIKFTPFRKKVKHAYNIVSRRHGLDSQMSSSDNSDGSELEMVEDMASKNVISNMMNDLYAEKKMNNNSKVMAVARAAANSGTIDISSDDSDDDTTDSDITPKEPVMPNLGNALTVRPISANNSQRSKFDEARVQSENQAAQTTQLHMSIMEEVPKKQDPKNLPQKPQDYAQLQVRHLKMVKLMPNPQKLPQHQNYYQQHHQLQQQQQKQQQQLYSQQTKKIPMMTSKRGNFEEIIPTEDRRFKKLKYNEHAIIENGPGGSASGRPPPRPPAANAGMPKYKKLISLRQPLETFADIGGMDQTLKHLCEILMHVKTFDIYFVLGVLPPRGILLHGSPGCGKTLLARAIAGQLEMPLIEIPATELITGVSGDSEERIRDVFQQAINCAPCVLFIDEIDVVSSNRTLAAKDMERRIVSQLISSMDSLKTTPGGDNVLVIGATTRPDVLDPGLRRAGRFDQEIGIDIPNRKDRHDILSVLCKGLNMDTDCDFDKIAELTPGYVGADLLALVTRAASITVKRYCAAQLEAQSNLAAADITIVDLDDDVADKKADNNCESISNTEESKNSAAADADVVLVENANENEPSIVAENNDKTNADVAKQAAVSEPMDVDAENVDKVGDTNIVASSDSAECKQLDETAASNDCNTTTSTATSAASKTITTATTADKSANVARHANAGKKSKINLSLLQWINWLKYPPEDVTLLQTYKINFEDFLEAVKVLQPSAKREGFTTVPDVTWNDVGSLREIREELRLAVLAPVKFPEKLERLGLTAPSGVLLCGPPGCGKTLIAKAIANEAGINFISVKGPELINMYVGESERAVRACFQRARNSAPCVIFFDEFDSLCPKRATGSDGGSSTRVVNQLLTEMDGVEGRKGVYVLAASNRPDIIDPAILRPGRLDTILYVGMPQQNDRVEILIAATKNRTSPVMADEVDFEEIAKKTRGYTGADLAGLVRCAAMISLKESIDKDIPDKDLQVNNLHFEAAIAKLRPSVTDVELLAYEKLRLKYAAPRATTVDNGVQ